MRICLGTTSSTGSAMVRDSKVQRVMLGSSKFLEGHEPLSICPNGASEESIGIYAKNRCQCTSCLIKIELEQGRYSHLNL